MITVKKKMKKPLIIAILGGILLIATTVAILLNVFLLNSNNAPGDDDEKIEIDESLGESIYSGRAVAFPHVAEGRMELIEIEGEYEYSFTRLDSILDLEEDDDLPPFILKYVDNNGVEQTYAPEIMAHDPTFTYEDSYASTESDGLGTSLSIYKLTYLCTALGTSYFDERIAVTDNVDVQQEELKVFGLSREDNPIKVTYWYYDENDELQVNYLTIGDRIIHDGGYYFMVNNRPYVYSTTNPYLEFAFMSFTDYIRPLLVAEGLPQDRAFEPYLTTDFKQWKNTLYREEGIAIKPGSTVAFTADERIAGFTVKKDGDLEYKDKVNSNEQFLFNLEQLSLNPAYSAVSKMLSGCLVGTLSSPKTATVYSFSTPVMLDANGVSKKYTYLIKSINSILTDGAEIDDTGTPVGENNLIKVTYAWFIDGERVSLNDFSGVIDISADAIPDDAEQKLRDAAVGPLNSAVSFDVTYDKTNTVHHDVSIIVTEIIEITDEDGLKVDKVADGTTVMFRYNTVVNGEAEEGSTTAYITLSDTMTDDEKEIAKLLRGKTVRDDYSIDVSVYSVDCEIVGGFTSYSVKSVEYFFTRETIVSFAFVQASERDAYFGESFYKNTMEDALYALNAPACQGVVKLLGGLNESATASLGLEGIETVDIGVTPHNLAKYGLLANMIYFELPRGISIVDYGDIPNDSFFARLDDYSYLDTIGFTLYISDPQIDGTRYIASDMYDVISKVDAEQFVFLDMSFEEFYARRNLVLVDISAINNITFEFKMDDLYGTYSNELYHQQLMAYNGKLYRESDLTEDQLKQATKYDSINVVVTPSGECIDTKFSEYLEQNGKTYDSLYNFFGKELVQLDTLGTSNFKELIEALFYTHYRGSLTEDEQKAGLENGAFVMKMTVRLYDDYGPNQYAYEFYKISDRRLMVRIYRENINSGIKNGVASSFYVSTFAYEKLVGLYIDLLNGENIESETTHFDPK